jgi:hypothetical protein
MRTPRTGLGSCRPLNTSFRGLIGIQDGCMMTQQSQRPPRVTDLQPWHTDAPPDKSSRTYLESVVVFGLHADFEGMRKKTAKEKKRGEPNFQIISNS